MNEKARVNEKAICNMHYDLFIITAPLLLRGPIVVEIVEKRRW